MGKKIAVISASWHESIVESAQNAFIEKVEEAGHKTKVIKVPGALEVPLAGKLAFEQGYDAAVGIAFIVDGGIYHRNFVAHTSLQSLLDVSLAANKPFMSVLLTPQHFEEGNAKHEQKFIDHMVIKGQEAAEAALQMLNITSAGLIKDAA